MYVCTDLSVQAFYRRGHATKFIQKEIEERRNGPTPNLKSVEGAILDYCHCFRLKNTDPIAMCEAIILTVEYCERPMCVLTHYCYRYQRTNCASGIMLTAWTEMMNSLSFSYVYSSSSTDNIS